MNHETVMGLFQSDDCVRYEEEGVGMVAVVMVVAEEKEMVYKSRFTEDLLRRQTPH